MVGSPRQNRRVALHRRIVRFPALLTALVLIAALLTGVGPSALAAPAARPKTYTNPLNLQVPGHGQAASCADPDVFHDRDGWWYLYCTSDALTEKPGADGKLVSHTLATFHSRNLVDWTYVGDAQQSNPSLGRFRCGFVGTRPGPPQR